MEDRHKDYREFDDKIQREIDEGAQLTPPVPVQGVPTLLILNSSYVGSRHLWWVDSPSATKGYNIYRAFDSPTNWHKLNQYPHPGHFYQDVSTLEQVTYTVQEKDWLERGQLGKWGFHIPDTPYSKVVLGRPVVATTPDDVTVILDGTPYRPIMIEGVDQSVWLQMDNTLPEGGGVSAVALVDNGNVNIADYSAVQVVQAVYNKLINFVDIYTTLVRTFYTVVPVGDRGEVHFPGVPGSKIVNTYEIDQTDFIFTEMVRRNGWVFERVAEPAYIMFRKTRGERCGCARTGLSQGRHGCPICFEVGIVGGYYGPYDFPYIDPDTAMHRELDEGGIKVTRESKSFLGPTPIIQDGDLIVRRNGERLVIHDVTTKSPRGVILQQEFGTELLKVKDTRYNIPINTNIPTIYNPIVTKNPLDGKGNGEPIVDQRTEPRPPEDRHGNPNHQVGRTIVWGKIQS